MKISIAGLITGLLLISFAGLAQQTDSGSQNKQTVRIPVTKGYYAIGNNAQKLNMGQPLEMRRSEIQFPPVTKGYFTIRNNNTKAGDYILVLPKSKTLPEVKKGYYSIGNNREKLQ